MRIGKQSDPVQQISTSDASSISIRGRDLCNDIIGRFGFTAYFWLMVTGSEPNPAQLKITDAVLTSIAEHGLVPSVVAARMTLAAAPEALQGAVAAGLLGCGSVVLGSAEAAAIQYHAWLGEAREKEFELSRVVEEGLVSLRRAKRPVPGFGHPLHSDGDPRATRLTSLAEELGIAGIYVRLLATIKELLPTSIGRTLPINVNGAIAAVMLDAGFPIAAIKGIALLARTAGLIAHLAEERDHPIGFILSKEAAAAISYKAP